MQLRISQKMALFAPLAVVGMVIVSAIFFTGAARQQELNERANGAADLAFKIGTINAHTIEARRIEKDYLLTGDETLIDQHAAVSSNIMTEIAGLKGLATATGNVSIKDDIDNLEAAYSGYAADFAKLVESHKVLGFTDSNGLRGELKAAVNDVESILSELEAPAFKISLLKMRTLERDFILTHLQTYADEHAFEIDAFKDIWDELGLSWLPQREPVNAKIDVYGEAFDKYVAETLHEAVLRGQLAAILEPIIDKMITEMNTLKANARTEATSAADTTFLVAVVAMVLGALVIGAIVWVISRSVRVPLDATGRVMGALAEGNVEIDIAGTERRDEIGEMARALAVFRDNELARRRAETEAEETRAANERDRAARDAERQAEAQDLQTAINALGEGLRDLASGNLAVRIGERFVPQLESLRDDFNLSIETLGETIQSAILSASTIGDGTRSIADAAEDLSRRTEQQAAALEQTAASLEHMTSTVRATAESAQNAGEQVASTSAAAEKSSSVVRDAVSAMAEIEGSSQQISDIINVIDEIAFQTNLLALNAGVEAARAGDAGKGFAVVAQEVRELAQRCSAAAQEIKELIEASGRKVSAGVELVGATGKALEAIVEQVGRINTDIVTIVTSTREQSTGIAEINVAIGEMDGNTQKNAVMVEQTTAGIRSLANEASALGENMAQFRLGKPARQNSAAPIAAPSRPVASPARRMIGNTALAASGEEWTEF